MPYRSPWTTLAILLGVVLLTPARAPECRAADSENSALPRREDVTYRMPGVSEISLAVLSWQRKIDDDSAFAGIDSVTPSVWLSGPVYSGITWFWKESSLPGQAGEIEFLGFASNQDTTIYDPPVRWLPLDPEASGSWETTTTSSKGEVWTFNFQYSGQVSVAAGPASDPVDYLCWMILLEQVPPAQAQTRAGAAERDGMGVLRLPDADSKAFTDILFYEVDALPRRRIGLRNAFPQSELLYQSHLTREPVSNQETGVGGFKARFRR